MTLIDRLRQITTFILDIDGVLTDGKLLVLPDGSLARSFSTRDGYAMKLATNLNYSIWICSGGYTMGIEQRFEKLGVAEIHMHVEDKLATVQNLIEKHNKDWREVAYLGDDVPDLASMMRCGLAACPADAASDIILASNFTSAQKGGDGFVRDVIEKVLRMRGDWPINQADVVA